MGSISGALVKTLVVNVVGMRSPFFLTLLRKQNHSFIIKH